MLYFVWLISYILKTRRKKPHDIITVLLPHTLFLIFCPFLLNYFAVGFGSMEYYMQKTYYKTASLISNSCKAIGLLAGQTAEVSTLAYEYGKNLVCTFFCCAFLAFYVPMKLDYRLLDV